MKILRLLFFLNYTKDSQEDCQKIQMVKFGRKVRKKCVAKNEIFKKNYLPEVDAITTGNEKNIYSNYKKR